MPELPEVETVRRGLAPAMEGALIRKVELRRPDLRFAFPPDFAARLVNRRILTLSRRAKYLIADLDNDTSLLMHLGMSGSFRVISEASGSAEPGTPGDFYHDRSRIAAHDHVIFSLEGCSGNVTIIYNDPRRFGFMDLFSRRDGSPNRFLAGLGLEPTGNELGPDAMARLFSKKTTPLKAALLDQRLIAGLGNIYVCEALWEAGLSPWREAGSLAGKGEAALHRRTRLSGSIRDVIARAIEAGGSSLRDYRLTDGSLGYFQHSFSVYDREGETCRRESCGGTIMRTVQSGRSTFHCPRCQK
ncbi:MAG: bifunctional DNA-formamidopyrimidine glycosylase/DNA-(apurinic or apyrimidinic site) lyase [Nitratireductor sp.]|nr:bifunctional DNA-formamidopyrimidine glycosylase/DNA-(apurinic or apyrimidinic site) lyase [Nitratireductor sp.]